MLGGYEKTVFKSRFNFLAFMLIAYLIAAFSTVTPIGSKRISREEIYNATVGIDQDLADFLLNEPSTNGYSPQSSIIKFQKYFIIFSITMIVIAIAISWVTIRWIILTRLKSTRNDKTWKLTVST